MASSNGGEGCIPDYEMLRNARVEDNKKRMLELGLANLSQNLAKDGKSLAPANGSVRSKAKTAASRISTPCSLPSRIPTRRSSRLQSTPAPCYKELSEKDTNSVRNPQQLQEYYTKEHEALLGLYKSEWELFKDGYGPDGARIYDPVKGKTCHQCRQKTLGLRTWCSNCETLQGQFCGDCLFMRYGENLLEVNQNKSWKCPSCRGICNCSICRVRKGLSPTGSCYKQAISLGYKSVAHFLILSNQIPVVTDGSTEVSDSSIKNFEDNLCTALPVRRQLDFISNDEEQPLEEKPQGNQLIPKDVDCALELNKSSRRKSALSGEDCETSDMPIGPAKMENPWVCMGTFKMERDEEHVLEQKPEGSKSMQRVAEFAIEPTKNGTRMSVLFDTSNMPIGSVKMENPGAYMGTVKIEKVDEGAVTAGIVHDPVNICTVDIDVSAELTQEPVKENVAGQLNAKSQDEEQIVERTTDGINKKMLIEAQCTVESTEEGTRRRALSGKDIDVSDLPVGIFKIEYPGECMGIINADQEGKAAVIAESNCKPTFQDEERTLEKKANEQNNTVPTQAECAVEPTKNGKRKRVTCKNTPTGFAKLENPDGCVVFINID